MSKKFEMEWYHWVLILGIGVLIFYLYGFGHFYPSLWFVVGKDIPLHACDFVENIPPVMTFPTGEVTGEVISVCRLKGYPVLPEISCPQDNYKIVVFDKVKYMGIGEEQWCFVKLEYLG